MICDYGCGQEAKYYFPTVNKWCCSSHFSKCPKRVDNVSGENNPMYGKESSFKGKHHSNESIEKMRKNSGVLKGKTYEEIYGIEKTKEIKKIRSISFSKQRKGKDPWNKGKTGIYSKEVLKK